MVTAILASCIKCAVNMGILDKIPYFNRSYVMTKNSKTQLGYFIDYRLWQDALKLLNFQIDQKKSNRHFNTLSMFYYEQLHVTYLNSEHYYDIKIATSLFYGLKKEFAVLPYVIPKPGLGLRDYKFFTYPMRVIYYAVGLYLLRLSQEFLLETYKKISRIKAFYGGNLNFKSEELQLSSKNVYYRSFYEKFISAIKQETQSDTKNKIVLKLDIENYFNELSIPILLNLLSNFIKPSVQANLVYDTFTKEQIICLLQFISNGKSGIPQSDNNIISNFIGYLYLVFGDLFVDDVIKNHNKIIKSYKIIRYTDDIYIVLKFESSLTKKYQGSYAYLIASQIAETLSIKLSLKLNLKTKLFRLFENKEKEELIKNIIKTSPNDEHYSAISEDESKKEQGVESAIETPQDQLEKIFQELEKIKISKVEEYFMRNRSQREEILQKVLNKSVENILNTEANKTRIKKIFNNFNFDLVKVKPLEILIILLKDETATTKFRKFILEKNMITTGDADLIIRFLCQTNFNDTELLQQLKKNHHMNDIVRIVLDDQLNCDKPGYYNLSCLQIKKLSEMPDVLDQIRLRALNEDSQSYSVALNHLVNEIHAVCIKQEQANKKNYDVNNVVEFLQSKGIDHEVCIKVRNLFDRRNSNSVSHPGSDGSLAWEVTKEEYLDYYKYIGKCLYFLL